MVYTWTYFELDMETFIIVNNKPVIGKILQFSETDTRLVFKKNDPLDHQIFQNFHLSKRDDGLITLWQPGLFNWNYKDGYLRFDGTVSSLFTTYTNLTGLCRIETCNYSERGHTLCVDSDGILNFHDQGSVVYSIFSNRTKTGTD
jgi:hypothetical protein